MNMSLNNLCLSVCVCERKLVDGNVFRDDVVACFVCSHPLVDGKSYSSLAELPWQHLTVMQHKTERKETGHEETNIGELLWLSVIGFLHLHLVDLLQCNLIKHFLWL